MEIILDKSLKINQLKTDDKSVFLQKLKSKGGNTITDTIEGDAFHKNILEYLEQCWANHYGVVITPDMVWYTVLGETAIHIKANAEKYRHLFTTSQEKKLIAVPKKDGLTLDLDAIVDGLNKLVPTDSEVFLPVFTTSTPESQFAFKAAFADAVSPYYNYVMYRCGISKVKILGTQEDWEKISIAVEKLGALLPLASGYYTKLVNTIKKFASPTAEDFKKLFSLKKCGSGHRTEVEGWIRDFYINVERPTYVGNFSTHISLVSYKDLDTDVNYEIKHGLFSSKITTDGYLEPLFGYVINELN